MTYHSSLDWNQEAELTDEITTKVVSEIVYGLGYNKEYNGGKEYTCDAYWLGGSSIDPLIHSIGKLLDRYSDSKSLTPDILNRWIGAAPEAVKIIVKAVIKEILGELHA